MHRIGFGCCRPFFSLFNFCVVLCIMSALQILFSVFPLVYTDLTFACTLMWLEKSETVVDFFSVSAFKNNNIFLSSSFLIYFF